jgi:hypothetical protein
MPYTKVVTSVTAPPCLNPPGPALANTDSCVEVNPR